MTINRTKNEILVRLSASTDINDLQDLLDYLAFKENVSISKATQKDADKLADETSKSIWKKIKDNGI